MPSDNDHSVLFESINVKRVRVDVFKVHADNIESFLYFGSFSGRKDQSSLDNEWEVDRVGLPLASQVVEIGTVENEWVVSELNLSSLINPYEKGLFYLKLSFSKSDILFDDIKISHFVDPNSDDTTIFTPRFYQNAQRVKPLIFSDLALSVKEHGNKLDVIVTDIKTGKPKKDVFVSVLTSQYQGSHSSKKIRTDGEGRAQLTKKEVSYSRSFIVAEDTGNRTVLDLTNDRLNMSSFDVGGAESNKSTNAFIYSDRGVYRPGDTVHLGVISRFKNQTLSQKENVPITLEVISPRSQVLHKSILKEGVDGFYSVDYALKPNAPTGKWVFRFSIGKYVFNTLVNVEMIVPNRLKVMVHADSSDLKGAENTIKGTLNSTYLVGKPSSGLSYDLGARLKKQNVTFSGYTGFMFDNETLDFSAKELIIGKGSLNDNGITSFSLSLPSFQSAPAYYSAVIEGKVFETGGRYTKGQTNVDIYPYSRVVGIEKDTSSFPVSVVLLNLEGTAIPGQTLTYSIYKNDRFWWWELMLLGLALFVLFLCYGTVAK